MAAGIFTLVEWVICGQVEVYKTGIWTNILQTIRPFRFLSKCSTISLHLLRHITKPVSWTAFFENLKRAHKSEKRRNPKWTVVNRVTLLIGLALLFVAVKPEFDGEQFICFGGNKFTRLSDHSVSSWPRNIKTEQCRAPPTMSHRLHANDN